jgi:hypothetical protein
MIAWLAACTQQTEQFVEPFDGSSRVLPGDPLVVHLSAKYPEGEALPDDLIVVVDLLSGGVVDGTTTFRDGAVSFEPDSPWQTGGRYGWAVSAPLPATRGPLLEVPPALVGEASFRVGGERELLEATLEGGKVCLLFSDLVEGVPRLAIGAREWIEPPSREGEVTLPGSPEQPGAPRCLELEGVGNDDVGSLVRVWSASGVTSSAVLRSETLEVAWQARHRWVQP